MRRLFLFFLALPLALGFLVMPSITKADDTITWDLTASSYSGTVPGAAGTAVYGFGSFTSNGLESSASPNGAGYYFMAANWPVDLVGVTGIKFHFQQPVNTFLFDFGSGMSSTVTTGTTTGTDYYLSYYGFGTIDVTTLNIYSDLRYSPFTLDYIEWTVVDSGGGGGLGDLTMPLASDDLHPQWGMFDPAYAHSLDPDWDDNPDLQPVLAFSNKTDVNVHAVAPGTVLTVRNIDADCTTLDHFGPALPRACFVIIPKAITGETSAILWTIEMPRAQSIRVISDDDPSVVFVYFVQGSSLSVGDHLDAGCVVGKSIQLTQPAVNLSGIVPSLSLGLGGGSVGLSFNTEFQSQLTTNSVTAVEAVHTDPEPISLLPSLTQEPDESQCQASHFGGCINGDSGFLDAEGPWASVGTQVTQIPGGGVSMEGGSQIQQQVNATLDDATSYIFNVQARSTEAGDGFTSVPRLKLFAGTYVEQFPVTTTWFNYQITVLGETLPPEAFIGISNQNSFPLEIRFACLSAEGSGTATSSCYFNNHHFDDGPTDWTLSNVTFDNGQAFMVNNSTLTQQAQLEPISESEAANYKLTVGGRLLATNAYTGQVGKSVEIDYLYPSSGSYTEVGTVDATAVDLEGRNTYDGTVNIEHPYLLTTTVTVSEHTNSNFSIKAVVSDTDNYLRGFRVDFVCLESPLPDGFPGQGGSGGFVPPFVIGCEEIATPIDNNINSWTFYHWSNLNRFFTCTLMIKLNSMAQTIDTSWKTMRLFLRWVIATAQMSGRWISLSLMPWLNGQFRNIAIGQVTTVYQSGGGSCNDVFCLLNNLINSVFGPIVESMVNAINSLVSIFTTGANLFLTVITGAVGVGIAVLTRVFSVFNQASGLLSGIITAYKTATPVVIDGLPMCSTDPESSLLCRGVWLMDNTAMAGRWGVLFTLILAISGIHLVLWVIGEFKRAIVSGSTA